MVTSYDEYRVEQRAKMDEMLTAFEEWFKALIVLHESRDVVDAIKCKDAKRDLLDKLTGTKENGRG